MPSWARAITAQDEPSLQALLAAERDRLYDHAGIDDWAGRVELPGQPGMLVTVLSRGVPSPEIRLALVSDLAPLWAARQKWIAQHPAAPDPGPRDAKPR